jgi:hypothetical protein
MRETPLHIAPQRKIASGPSEYMITDLHCAYVYKYVYLKITVSLNMDFIQQTVIWKAITFNILSLIFI